jgi:hypothetical protein
MYNVLAKKNTTTTSFFNNSYKKLIFERKKKLDGLARQPVSWLGLNLSLCPSSKVGFVQPHF